MNHAVTLFLALAGSTCAACSLAAGEALRANDQPFTRRTSPRLLLALVFLGLAIIGGIVQATQITAGSAGLAWLTPAFLAAGLGTTVLAYVRAPYRRGDESLGERLTPYGKAALALLTAAIVLDLVAGPVATGMSQLRGQRVAAAPVLVLLGLVFAALATGTTAVLFRSAKILLPGEGPPLRRLSRLARATLALLGLALGAAGLAAWIVPGSNVFLACLLLGLSLPIGLVGAVRAVKAAPAQGGISPHGWIALALLGMTSLLLGAQEIRLLVGAELQQPLAVQPENGKADSAEDWRRRLDADDVEVINVRKILRERTGAAAEAKSPKSPKE